MKDTEKEDYVLNDRFKAIYEVLKSKHKVKEIIEKLNFSGSRQLYNILENKNLVSTRAIDRLIKQFNVNPTFIFSGTGSMFIDKNKDVPEDLELYRKGKEEADELILKLYEDIKRLEDRIEHKEQAFNAVVKTIKEDWISMKVKKGKTLLYQNRNGI